MDQINCTDRCGRWVVDDQTALQQGWTYLEITRRWRCPVCVREAAQASAYEGRPGQWPFDEIPASSIGALSKPTADTIVSPVVPAFTPGGGGDFSGGGADTSYEDKQERVAEMFEQAEQSVSAPSPAPEPSPSPSPEPSPAPDPSPSPSPSSDW